MSTINILIAVDGASIAQQVNDQKLSPGTQASPTGLGAWGSSNVYIAMVAPNSTVSNGSQGQSELYVNALSGDTVEWAITTFDNNFDQTPYLYDGTFNVQSAPATPLPISALSYACSQAANYLDPNNPPASSLTEFVNQVSTVSATIQRLNVTIQYTLSFVLVNNATGTIIGYFSWDPFIVVGN